MALKAVLFDLGGVLLPFDRELRVTTIVARTGATPAAVRDFMALGLHQALDRGEADEFDLASAMSAVFGLRVTPAEAIDLVCSVFEEPNDELWALAAALRSRVIVGGFSDNPAFVERMFPPGAFLDPMFFSSRLRATKPAAPAFLTVETALGLAPSEIAFIDDTPANIVAATARGWDGIVYESNAQVRDALAARGLA